MADITEYRLQVTVDVLAQLLYEKLADRYREPEHFNHMDYVHKFISNKLTIIQSGEGYE